MLCEFLEFLIQLLEKSPGIEYKYNNFIQMKF